MKDRHERMRLANERDLKIAELNAKQGDDQAKIQVQNQKAMESREAHQAEMIGKQQDMVLAQHKADLATQQHQLRATESAQRGALAEQAAAQKAQQGPI